MSEYVIMPKSDYVDACDAIRAKTETVDAITSGQLKGLIESISGSSEDVRYVTFMSYDGTIEYGKKAVAVGDDCADPIARGVFGTPTKESDVQYTYAFAGWATEVNGALNSVALKAVEEDRTVYANFAAVVRYYTITYYDDDGATVLKTESLPYGSTPSYIPTKDGHKFTGWQPELAAVTGDANYTATWEALAAFGTAPWEEIVSIVESGQAKEYFNIGDERIVAYGDSNVTLQIIGFNHDELSDGSGKAGMTIWTKNIPETSRINAGSSTSGGYGSSIIANNLASSYFSKLPAEIVESAKTVKKYFFNGRTTGQALTSTSKNVWLLSVTEIGAENEAYNYNEQYFAEGTRYAYFDGTNAKRNKGAEWWTRSVNTPGTSGTYSYVTSNGSINETAATTSKGIVFGFCI